MVKVKSLADIQANYTNAASTAAQKYTKGVQSATGWQANSIAAQPLYQSALEASFTRQSRVKGIQKVSDAAWQSASLNLGAARIGTGMTNAAGKQATNFAPYKSVIEGVTLAARTTDPATNVQNRVLPIVLALHKAKTGM
jgi:hypothetical protein